eukprot:3113569-Rhodomonas_salina.4
MHPWLWDPFRHSEWDVAKGWTPDLWNSTPVSALAKELCGSCTASAGSHLRCCLGPRSRTWAGAVSCFSPLIRTVARRWVCADVRAADPQSRKGQAGADPAWA